MPARGIQHLPIRYPREAPAWFAQFMDSFIRDVLINLDVRNAIQGQGIQIEGNSDTPATISSSEDVQQLIDENYILAESSPFLANARVLSGENGVVRVTDEGPGGSFVISLEQGGIPYDKLAELDELSVLGNPSDAFGPLTRITGSAQHDVLSVQLNGSDLEVRFGTITHQSVSDFDEAAQDAVGAALADSDTVNLTYTDATPEIKADVITQMSITADSSGLKLVGDTASPGNSKYYGTDSSGNRGWLASGGGGGGSVEFIDQSVVAGSAATNITVSSLDLAGDDCYIIDLLLLNSSGSSTNVSLFYNSDTTATNYNRNISTDGGTGTRVNNAIIAALSAGEALYIRLTVRPDIEGRTRALVNGSAHDGAASVGFTGQHIWQTVSNVTSVTINSSVATAFAVGSKVQVWRQRAS
jgi:hypothetical protein